MMSTVKVLLLMALLTGMIYGICYMLGFPPIFAILLALIPNLISYFYSDKIVLSSYGAKIVDENEAPNLHRIVESIANRANIQKPKVAIINTDTPNAFATGRSPKNGVVAVTTGILQLLNEQELEGVLAHEIGHIKHRDILIGTMVATMAGAIMYIANFLQWGMLFGYGRDDDGNPLQIVASLLFIILAPIAAMVVQFAISRQNEYNADENGAKYSNPIYLANALTKLEKGVKYHPLRNGSPATAHMFIVNPFKAGNVARLFSTHPSTEERVKRLMEMASNPKYLR
ncbi:zinc metalloprotease HtpX [Methanococcus maripaludis]|uniref:Protease HtpX homolog n=2 Tax=Methanococcus maripaludis TaxID=39152 RepID=A0A8T3W8V0_METMI|nr:zinc metalloprotease HtpX [Methanococcus maripaludis]MBG0769603.1 zinc metalloprotease HtpX [Methanococcus maripaludis]BAP60535.1 putative protease [Methanococcus maripaludis KA1]